VTELKKIKEPAPGALAVVGEGELKGRKNALDLMAARLDVTPEVLRKTLMATAFNLCKEEAQFISAVIVANTYQLNPILKEMTAFPGKAGGVVPIVMVDGWIKLVNRQNDYDGVELTENKTADNKPNKSGTMVDSVTAKFYLKNREHPVVVTEYMDECFDGTKEPWKRWPRRMLRHKAYIQGARIAFGFAGIYDEDEAARIREAEAIDITDPIIGLKHDKDQKPGQAEGAQVAAAAADAGSGVGAEHKEVELVAEWYDIGEQVRFPKKDANSVKFMAQNLSKCAQKLGKENFMRMLGQNGIESLEQIYELKDLVKITNLALEEAKKLEAGA
jgi:phage recombination protein Bet